jgi:hypothetical protein
MPGLATLDKRPKVKIKLSSHCLQSLTEEKASNNIMPIKGNNTIFS